MSPENKSVSLHDAVKLLLEADDIYLLCHQYPDGDTLGSAAALYLGLRQKGKRVSIRCGDPIPQKYDYMFEGIEFPDFEPQFICAVDIADPQLLGQRLSPYAQRVDLCIDHHGSNTKYARQYVIRPRRPPLQRSCMICCLPWKRRSPLRSRIAFIPASPRIPAVSVIPTPPPGPILWRLI